jgi:hypothetical protein
MRRYDQDDLCHEFPHLEGRLQPTHFWGRTKSRAQALASQRAIRWTRREDADLSLPFSFTFREVTGLFGRMCEGHLPIPGSLRPAGLHILFYSGKMVTIRRGLIKHRVNSNVQRVPRYGFSKRRGRLNLVHPRDTLPSNDCIDDGHGMLHHD